jgi:conjugal transfer ATP-binding protein TraC
MKLPFLSKSPAPAAAKTAVPAATKAAGKTGTAKTPPPPPPTSKAIESMEKGLTSVVDIIAPSSVEVDFRYIRVGDVYYTTLFAAGYPRYVSPGWLQPIIDYDHTLDIAMFCYPTSSADILADLKRKIGEMEATLSSDAEAGKVADPSVEAALEDALGLQEELAKGIERFFQFGFYLTVSDEELPKLKDTVKELQTALSGLLVTGKIATLQMEEGFKTTVPLGIDKLYVTRNMDTSSLASTFPFTSAILTQNKGVMYGVNQQNGSLIIFDRFSLENANEVVLGKSGAGKSYTIKLEISRQFMLGAEVIVIDPDGEYVTLTPALGGEVVDFSSSSEIKINPFDLSDIYEEGENELGLKILSLHGLLKIITGDLDAEHDAILDRALIECYRQKGITTDPDTQKREPPLMEDLYKTLLGMESQPSRELAYMLEKFIKGSAAGIFNQQSNFAINNPLTVFSIRNMEEALRPVAMHIILDFVWTKVKKSLKKRILILDEGWYMMKYPDSASFVYSIAKRARKYYLGLTTATQDVEDFLKNEYGKAVLTNSSIQVLLKQGTAEVDMIAETFYLSEGEKALLLSSDVGEGLFFAGQNHVAMKVFAAPFEHELITSNPIELLKRQQDKEQMLKAEGKEAEADKAEEPAETPPTEPAPAEPSPHSYSSHTPAPAAEGGTASPASPEAAPANTSTPTPASEEPKDPVASLDGHAVPSGAHPSSNPMTPPPTDHVPGSPAALAAEKMAADAAKHASESSTDPSAAPILPKPSGASPFAPPTNTTAPASPAAPTPEHPTLVNSPHIGGNVPAPTTGLGTADPTKA